ncbi:hypothetical protein SAMN05421819_2356 [Bryocella elongata]|uniref:Uncharacterized protein n=1 Tax=Bryocella elongata TaxID=863522 RepID=A0A1H5YLM0_9BACT|nr:hypothetical protein [Bryocella elongata]SEG24397.1 hypothetical protein SAMN05421819_2356 [Bryocella elongata]
MLDVHPPHHPTHTWTDFFIHIATIVVGLLIAIGLEQTVERIHEHYELRETREALADERVANRELVTKDQQEWLEVYRELRSNLEVLTYLRSHPGTKQADLPAALDWMQSPFLYKHAVWDAAEQNGVVHHMPLEEANQYQDFYEVLRVIGAQSLATWDAINDAARYNLLDPDPTHLSAAELDEEIRLARTALEKHFEMGYSLARIANTYRDMPRAVNYSPVLDHLRRTAFDLDPVGMKAAQDRLTERIKGTAGGTAVDPGR